MTVLKPSRPPVSRQDTARETQARLRSRLEEEGEFELLAKMRKCGEPIVLKCVCCSKSREAKQVCRRKWCPSCQRAIAAERSERFSRFAAEFKSPLFLTLTMPNEFDLKKEPIKKLKVAVRRLRRTIAWKYAVAGGIGTIEVTNKGKGYHVHAHFLLDCVWLSDGVPAPAYRASRSETEHACKAAKLSFEDLWAWCCRVPRAVCHMARCDRKAIAKEIVKYAVKGNELVDQKEPIGDILRAIDAGRMLSTFGHCQRKSKFHLAVLDIMKEEDDRPGYEQLPEGMRCCQDPHQVPIQFWDAAKSNRHKRILRGIEKRFASNQRAKALGDALSRPFGTTEGKKMSSPNNVLSKKTSSIERRAQEARREILARWGASDPTRAAKAALRQS